MNKAILVATLAAIGSLFSLPFSSVPPGYKADIPTGIEESVEYDGVALENIWNKPLKNGYFKITNAKAGYERSGINLTTSSFVDWGAIKKNDKNGERDYPNGYMMRICAENVNDYTFRPGIKTTMFAFGKSNDEFLSYKPYNGGAYIRWSGEIKNSDDQKFVFERAVGTTDRKYIAIKNVKSNKYLYMSSSGKIRCDGLSSRDKSAQWLFIPFTSTRYMLDANRNPIT